YRLDPPVFVVSGPFLSYFILPPPRSTLFPYTTLFRSTAERRAAGHAEDVGDGQARKDKRHGLRAPVRRYEVCRNDGGDAEEGRMAERRDDARRDQKLIAGRQRAKEIAGDEDGHQGEERGLTPPSIGQDRHDGRADNDARSIGGDDHAGTRDGDAEIGGDVGQQAHDDELGGADAERRGGKGKKGKHHRRTLSWPGASPGPNMMESKPCRVLRDCAGPGFSAAGASASADSRAAPPSRFRGRCRGRAGHNWARLRAP